MGTKLFIWLPGLRVCVFLVSIDVGIEYFRGRVLVASRSSCVSSARVIVPEP
jgi:hypothetical protein